MASERASDRYHYLFCGDQTLALRSIRVHSRRVRIQRTMYGQFPFIRVLFSAGRHHEDAGCEFDGPRAPEPYAPVGRNLGTDGSTPPCCRNAASTPSGRDDHLCPMATQQAGIIGTTRPTVCRIAAEGPKLVGPNPHSVWWPALRSAAAASAACLLFRNNQRNTGWLGQQ